MKRSETQQDVGWMKVTKPNINQLVRFVSGENAVVLSNYGV
ncbi:hypothetical protein [Dactylococcopsis salina]|nr:hypothetical protein [Dactylococcopsis salina]